MSGLDPLASAGGNASASAADQIAAEIQALAADAQTLRALLEPGDVVTGTVLRFNGLTDLLDIFGLKVVASLPPGVHPGDAVTLEVQGFNGDTILVKLIAAEPPASGSIPPALVGTPITEGGTPVPAPGQLVPEALPEAASATPAAAQLPAPPAAGAPASGQPAPAAAAAVPAGETPAAAPPASVFVAASVQPSTRPAQPAVPIPASPASAIPSEVEARLALTRAAQVPSPAPRAPAAPPQSPSQTKAQPPPASAAAQTSGAPAAASQRAQIQPQVRGAHVQAQAAQAQAAQKSISQRQAAPPAPVPPRAGTAPAPPPGAPSRPAAARPPAPAPAVPRGAYLSIGTRTAERPQPQPIPGAPAQIGAPSRPVANAAAMRTPPIVPAALLDDPTALLRTLRIPVSPTSLTFAKLVTREPEQVAPALRALESSLPNVDDSRIQTLRTLAAFVGQLDPKAPTFTTQVASFISHVVEGPEAKLAALLAPPAPEVAPQPTAAQPPTPQQAPSQPAGGASAQPVAPQSAPAATQVPPIVPVDPSAGAVHAAERVAAASHDLKTQLLALLATPGGTAATLGDAGTAVAQNALTAVVVNQLSTLAAQQPGAWMFTIPIVVDRELYPAKVRVDRDKGDGQDPLTGDDFHIAFILETPRLGTVAIDMRAVGRSVSVSVKTEREGAVSSFKGALAQLGERLASMRYNVKSLDAALAPHRPVPGADASAEPGPNATMERRA